jgi:thymidylate kinase
MIINVTGLPGAGKSTCESYLISGLENRGLDVIQTFALKNKYIKDKIYSQFDRESVSGILPRLIFQAKVFQFYFEVCINNKRSLEFLIKKKRAKGVWLSQDIILSRYFIEDFQASNPKDLIYFCTEGLVHHWACMKVWSGRHSIVFNENWLNRYPSEEILIIYLKLPLSMALDRLVSRGVPSIWPKSDKDFLTHTRKILERYDIAISETINEFSSKGARVHTVDVSCGKDQIESEIIDCLDSIFHKTTAFQRP